MIVAPTTCIPSGHISTSPTRMNDEYPAFITEKGYLRSTDSRTEADTPGRHANDVAVLRSLLFAGHRGAIVELCIVELRE